MIDRLSFSITLELSQRRKRALCSSYRRIKVSVFQLVGRKLEILGSVNLDIFLFRDTLHYCLRCWKEVESRPRVGLADFLILCS